ncbi:hypothetical protein CP02DC21_1615A, partial [Chlamydia psittaci 02DC21]
MIRSHLVKPG